MSEAIFLDRATIEKIHEASILAFGGSHGIRDLNALESAIAQPVHEFCYGQADLFRLAAAYAYHIAENQPYVDGNKRTALLSALNFLEMNGMNARVPSDLFYDAMIGIAEKRLDKAGLAGVFQSVLSVHEDHSPSHSTGPGLRLAPTRRFRP